MKHRRFLSNEKTYKKEITRERIMYMINREKTKQLISIVCTLTLLGGTFLMSSCNTKSANSGSSGNSGNELTGVADEKELTAVRDGLKVESELKGFGELSKMELYVNGIRSAKNTVLKPQDNKKIYYSGEQIRVVNYADGYRMDMPAGWKPDFSMSSLRCRYGDASTQLIISRETPLYPDMDKYLSECLNRYILNEDYRKNNNVTLLGDVTTKTIDKFTAQIIKLKLEDMPEGSLVYYTYVTLYNTTNRVYRLMFKSSSDQDFVTVADSFVGMVPQGACIDTKTYPLTLNPKWDEKTKQYYNYLQNSNQVDWGLFTSKIESTGIRLTIPRMEEKLGYKFPVISQYVHLGWDKQIGIDFPRKFADTVDSQGKILQLTYQFTTNNNVDLTAYTPSLDVYRGKMDDVLRNFAQQIKDYGKPVLFRLNNEMNTDWTSYCAMANLDDPDIFVQNWVRMYNIFQEVGATNTIWIFNAFDGNYPGNKWNNWRCYFPPVECVQLLGITGYNSGTFYSFESWREFEPIYDNIEAEYKPYFKDWPWIISEFGSSGIGGDKAAWIKSMFDCFEKKKYSNIKVAVWFNAADYDAETNQVCRSFWLDETEESLAAFRDGLQRTQVKKQ